MRPIDNFYYMILFRYIKKFYILKLNINKNHWVDCDERLFAACFAILENYVEYELGKVDKNTHPECRYRGYRLHSDDEAAIDLYLWYKEELPKEKAAYRDYSHRKYKQKRMLTKSKSSGWVEITFEDTGVIETTPGEDEKYDHHYIENLKDKKLRELIDMRRTLWT